MHRFLRALSATLVISVVLGALGFAAEAPKGDGEEEQGGERAGGTVHAGYVDRDAVESSRPPGRTRRHGFGGGGAEGAVSGAGALRSAGDSVSERSRLVGPMTSDHEGFSKVPASFPREQTKGA